MNDEGNLTRGPIDALRTSLRNGIRRYKALADAKETQWLLAGFGLSCIGYRFMTVVLVVLSFQLGEGALGVGGMLAITMIPGIVLQPFSGSLVDRFPGKRTLVLCQVGIVFIALSYLMLYRIESIWLLYAIAFARGIIFTVDAPAYEVRLVALTPAEKRGTANAVQSLVGEIGEIVGPLLGGLLLVLLGGPTVFILAACIFAVYAFMIARLPERVAGAGREVEEGSDEEAENQEAARQGYRGIVTRPAVSLYMIQVLGSYILVYGMVPLFILRALELDMNEASIGIFYAAMGVGGFFGSIFSGMGEYSTRRALAITGTTAAIGGVAVMLFGIAGTPLLALALLVLVGLLAEIEEIPAITYFQNSLPEGIYGRFFSLFMMATIVGGLVGSLLAPFLADRYSTAFALTALGVPMVFFGLVLAVRGGGLQFSRHPFAAAAAPAVISAPLIVSADEPDKSDSSDMKIGSD